MSPAPLSSATTLSRAARYEHARITSERGRIRERIAQLRSELESLEQVDHELADQTRLLDQVIATEPGVGSNAEKVVLRGARLREEALRVLVARTGIREPIFYRDWYRLVRDAGFVVLAKRPEAAFLTTVTRSPLVERAPESGTYYVEPAVADDLRQELRERQAELRDLEAHLATRPPGQTPLRRHRLNLMATIRRLERQVSEADRVLAARHESAFAAVGRAA